MVTQAPKDTTRKMEAKARDTTKKAAATAKKKSAHKKKAPADTTAKKP
jgi:hypothetical protein